MACFAGCPHQVRLFDEDLFTSDDDLGTAMVSLAALEPGKTQDLSLELKGVFVLRVYTCACACLRVSACMRGACLSQVGVRQGPAAKREKTISLLALAPSCTPFRALPGLGPDPSLATRLQASLAPWPLVPLQHFLPWALRARPTSPKASPRLRDCLVSKKARMFLCL